MLIYIKWGGILFILMMLFAGLSLWMMLGGESWVMGYTIFSNDIYMDFLLVFDMLSVTYFTVVLAISFCVICYSFSYMEGDLYIKRFCYLMLLFITSMGLMVLSPNMISVLLGWDGLGLVSYCLVIYYQSWKSYGGGMLTVLSNRIGDVGILLGVTYMVVYGGWSFSLIGVMEDKNLMILGGLLLLGGVTKSAQFPFSAWLPAAMAAPTPVSSLVHSSTLVTAGVYIFIRNHEFLEVSGSFWWLKLMSLLTLLLAGFSACLEQDMKKVVALSTLSQLGIMMYTLSIGLWWLAYFHMMMHALFKALLFLCMGSIIHGKGGAQDIRVMGGLVNGSPLVSLGVFISSSSLVGLPFSCGFYSKDLIIEMMFSSGIGVIEGLLFWVGICLTMGYSARLIKKVMLGEYMGHGVSVYGEVMGMNLPIMILMSLSIFMGSVMQWLMFDYIETPILPLWLKLTPVLAILLSLVVFLGGEIKLGKSKANFIKEMWEVPFCSVWVGGFMAQKISKILYMESSWVEMVGGSGLGMVGKWLKIMNKMQLGYKFGFVMLGGLFIYFTFI